MATAAQLKAACIAAANTHLNTLAAAYNFADITEAVTFAASDDAKFRRLGLEAVHIRDQVFQRVRQALQDAVPANVADANAFATAVAATFPAARSRASLEGDLG